MAEIEHRAASRQLVHAEAQARRLEARMRQAQKMESLGLLAGGIAHDFNNLLTAILGNADMARGYLDDNSPAQPSLRGVEAAARRAAALCKEMLAFAGRGRIDIGRVDLNEIVTDLQQIFEASLSKKIEFDLDLDPELSLLRADAGQMSQLVMNLLINANEAIGDDPGRIRMRTRVVECDASELAMSYLADELPEGPYVELCVHDDGCGMSPDTLERLFDPFFSTKFAGRGLGLATVLGAVRRHHGAISVASELRGGTKFRVLFPAVDGLRRPTIVPSPPTGEPALAGDSQMVMLVDDESIVRDVGARMLERGGFRVCAAPDGPAAIELLREHGCDIACVVLDLTMPKMDGVETFAILRSIAPKLPVVLSTGHAEDQLIARLRDAKIDGFISKPYVYAQLMDKLRGVLGT